MLMRANGAQMLKISLSNGAVHASLHKEREREMRSAWWDIKESVLGRVGRAVDAAARDFAREVAQLENGGGREAAAERLCGAAG